MIVGVDEVGRGPLAGPVVACAVFDDPVLKSMPWGDSKALSASKRRHFIEQLQGHEVPYALGQCEAHEVDALNVLQATFEAMRRAVDGLEAMVGTQVTMAYVDGNADPGLGRPVETVIKGDARMPCIGAASIVAKEHRDALMRQLDTAYSGYGFASNAGYGTRQHLEGLAERGPCCEHRLSFAPVRQAVVAGRHRRGRAAEDLAVARLEEAGLTVLARNWSGRRGELDVVCDNGLELVVVEVRSRRDHVDPLETLVARSKWMKIRRTTEELLYRLRLDDRFVRFDVMAVQGEDVAWLEDAWRPN
jgi:ribonuclease HII